MGYNKAIMEEVPNKAGPPMKEEITMGEDVKTSKAQQRAVHKYVKANYDRLDLTMPKGQKETVKAHAAAQGESVNAFINRAISEAMPITITVHIGNYTVTIRIKGRNRHPGR